MIKIVKHPKASNLDKVRAAELIMAYGYGRPVESHELSGPDGKPLGSFTAPPSVHVHFGNREFEACVAKMRQDELSKPGLNHAMKLHDKRPIVLVYDFRKESIWHTNVRFKFFN